MVVVMLQARGWLSAGELVLTRQARLKPFIVQVGSNDEPDATSEFDKIVEDMTWVAELGAKQNPPVKISYEPWCFSPHTSDWESCWKIVKAAVSVLGTCREHLASLAQCFFLGLRIIITLVFASTQLILRSLQLTGTILGPVKVTPNLTFKPSLNEYVRFQGIKSTFSRSPI